MDKLIHITKQAPEYRTFSDNGSWAPVSEVCV